MLPIPRNLPSFAMRAQYYKLLPFQGSHRQPNWICGLTLLNTFIPIFKLGPQKKEYIRLYLEIKCLRPPKKSRHPALAPGPLPCFRHQVQMFAAQRHSLAPQCHSHCTCLLHTFFPASPSLMSTLDNYLENQMWRELRRNTQGYAHALAQKNSHATYPSGESNS